MTQLSLAGLTANTTDYLINSPAGYDTFIMKINNFTDNGKAVDIPGLNSKFGMYIEGTVAVSGVPSVYGPGSIQLMLDPTNNDGTPHANFNPTTLASSVTFSNPTGQADDITLASGQTVSGVFGPQSNGQMGLQLVDTFNPSYQLAQLLHGAGALNIDTNFFNTATSRQPYQTSEGQFVVVNDGYGTVNLVPADGSTDDTTVPLGRLVSTLDQMSFLHGREMG
jgi:hypothetical protein